jgi:hypothetical protein
MSQSWSSFYNRPITSDEELLYEHLVRISQFEGAREILDRFRKLLIEGQGYPETEMSTVVERIVTSNKGALEYKFILNRCCYILINRWLLQPRLQGAIPHLVRMFEQGPSGPTYVRSAQRLRELNREFLQTEQFLSLRRLAELARQDLALDQEADRPLSSYIRRYPYLYEHCLLADDSGEDQRSTVRQIQTNAQKQFEVDLSQYVTYQIVRPQSGRLIEVPSQVKNPTLLSDEALYGALHHFTAKVDGRHTQRDLAQHFLAYSRGAQNLGSLKQDLYEYLASAVPTEYGQRQFYNRLYGQIQSSMAENDGDRPNQFLLMRLCSRLMNFLVVDNPGQPSHFIFLDLVANLGTTFTVGLLLKLTLLCQKLKPHLERRFSILFNHYEHCTQDNGIGWLIESLETLNVAFATNFGLLNFNHKLT